MECALTGFIHLVDKQDISKKRKDDLIRWFFRYMSNSNFDKPAPFIAREIHAYLRNELNCNDLYADDKKQDNDRILSMLPEFQRAVDSDPDPQIAALKLAIAGNIIDLGTNHGMNHTEVIENAIARELAVDDFSMLSTQIKVSNNFLYLCDNAGEIVFDKLFIDTLVKLGVLDKKQITLAVRGEPIINDATLEDAAYVGLDRDYKVISNGDCAPGTCLGFTSPEFIKAFSEADFIISKGQGNFESLISNKDKTIFFMLIAKCSLVADHLGVNVGDMVCKLHKNEAEKR